jgi:endonuclease YncB( thermonuclease family)
MVHMGRSANNTALWTLLAGLALADRRFGRAYVPVEEAARAAVRGIWAGDFEAPWDWRRARRRG